MYKFADGFGEWAWWCLGGSGSRSGGKVEGDREGLEVENEMWWVEAE